MEYRLQEKGTGRVAARATLWEMDTFNQYWGENGVGIVDLAVAPDLRRQGLAKFLLSQVLRHLHEQFFSLVEVRAPDQVGLLYRIGHALHALDLDIHQARIDTHPEGALDVFYVRDLNGEKLSAPTAARAAQDIAARLRGEAPITRSSRGYSGTPSSASP